MRWFKHISLSQTDETLSELMDKFGAEGYGVWWLILEKIALGMDETDRCFVRYSLRVWSTFTKVSPKRLQMIVKFLKEKNKFTTKLEGEYLTIECPNLLKYRDEWAKKKKREKEKTLEELQRNSGETPEQLRSKISDTESDTETNKKHSSADAERKKSAVEILNFLNRKAEKNFEPVKANLDLIIARLKEGSTIDDCRMVIASKLREWETDPELKKYLRPKTLFNRTNFAQYKGELVEPEENANG